MRAVLLSKREANLAPRAVIQYILRKSKFRQLLRLQCIQKQLFQMIRTALLFRSGNDDAFYSGTLLAGYPAHPDGFNDSIS